jgi:hypothetical protein
VPHSVQNVLREVDDSDLDALLDTALRPQHAARKPVVETPKPTSALSSLVAEEEAWLHRAREKRQERGAGEAVPAPDAVEAVAPVAPAVEPVVAPPVAPEVAVAPVPVVPVMEDEVPTEVTPPPVAPDVRPQRSRWLMLGGLLGTGVLGALAGALMMRPAERSEPVTQPQAPAVAAPAPAVVAPAPVVAAPAPTPAPGGAAPVAPAPAVAAPVAAAPAPAVAAPPPAVVTPAPVVAAPPPVAAATPAPQPVPVAAPPVEKAPAVVAKKESPVSRPVEKVARLPERTVPRSEPVPEKKKVAAVERSDDELDDDFARELGFTSQSSRQKKSTVEDDGRPESLSTSDILQVVAGHKGDVVSCIQQHSPPKPESGQGRFVVRWRLRTDGGTTDVLLEDEHLKGSPFAKCIESQVRSWKFSPHRVQRREPVRFPFTY